MHRISSEVSSSRKSKDDKDTDEEDDDKSTSGKADAKEGESDDKVCLYFNILQWNKLFNN